MGYLLTLLNRKIQLYTFWIQVSVVMKKIRRICVLHQDNKELSVIYCLLFYKDLLEHGHLLERFLFLSFSILLSHHAMFPGDPGGWRIIKLPLIIIAHVSTRHQLQGDCVSSWLVPTLPGFSLCHLAPVSCPPSCSVTSTHCKQLRGTNSEKPELWVTDGRETSELTAMNTQRRPILLGNKTQQWPPVWQCVEIDPHALCTGLYTWT